MAFARSNGDLGEATRAWATARWHTEHAMPDKRYRVAVIGSTGRGDYGHGLDAAFRGVDRAEIVAVADDNPAGLRKVGERLGVSALFADYREMLDQLKPDVVCIGPTWLTDRVAMLQAVAERGCHIYSEKPLV